MLANWKMTNHGNFKMNLVFTLLTCLPYEEKNTLTGPSGRHLLGTLGSMLIALEPASGTYCIPSAPPPPPPSPVPQSDKLTLSKLEVICNRLTLSGSGVRGGEVQFNMQSSITNSPPSSSVSDPNGGDSDQVLMVLWRVAPRGRDFTSSSLVALLVLRPMDSYPSSDSEGAAAIGPRTVSDRSRL